MPLLRHASILTIAAATTLALTSPATASPTLNWQSMTVPGVTDTVQDSEIVLQPISDTDVWAFATHPSKTDDKKSVDVSQHWDGKTWSAAPVPEVGTVRAATARSAKDIWVAGASDEGSKMAHWDGKSWTASSLPDGDVSVRVLTVIDGELWAAGGCCGTRGWAAHYVDGQWHQLSVHEDGLVHYVNGFAKSADGSVWADGAASTDDGTRPMLEKVDGDALTAQTPPKNADKDREMTTMIAANGGRDLWALGATTDDARNAVLWHHDAKGWSDESAPAHANCRLSTVARVGHDLYAFASDAKNCALRLSPSSKKWESVTAPPLPSGATAQSITGDTIWVYSRDINNKPVIVTAKAPSGGAC